MRFLFMAGNRVALSSSRMAMASRQIVVYQGFFRWLFDLLHLKIILSGCVVQIVNRLMDILAKDRDKIPV